MLGEEDAAAFVRVEHREGPARLAGFVARPDRHRPTLAGVYLYVNRRPVRDRTLQHALVEVYRDWLPRGRFPAAVLFVELPPEAVDVNVHPAKWEVRFADPPALHRLVRHGVAAAIETRRWLAPAASRRPGAFAGRRREARARPATGSSPRPRRPPASAGVVRDAAEPERSRCASASCGCSARCSRPTWWSRPSRACCCVDQHAAHERVLYERLRAGWRQREIESQLLLVPLTLAARARAGRPARGAGRRRRRLRLRPRAVRRRHRRGARGAGAARGPRSRGAGAGAARQLARDARRRARPAPSAEAADRLFASLACHAARRKGEVLSPAEQRALLDALDAIPWAPTCPHGRPVAVPFDLPEIERRFGRR